jgi:hypothetical protein
MVPVRERRPYELDETCLRVTRDHKTNSYNFVYLETPAHVRDASIPLKQKTFQTSDIRNRIRARKLKVLENGDVECKWHRDVPGFNHDHTTIFPVRSSLTTGREETEF